MYDEQFLEIPCSSVALSEYKKLERCVSVFGYAIKTLRTNVRKLKETVRKLEPKVRIEFLPEARAWCTHVTVSEHELRYARDPHYFIAYVCKRVEYDLSQVLNQIKAKP